MFLFPLAKQPVKPLIGQLRRGLTLIEMSLVFVILAGVLVGSLVIYGRVQDRQQENETKALVQTLVSGTKALYAGSIDYDSIGTGRNDLPNFVTDGGSVPATSLNSNFGSGIVSPFNQEVRMQAHSNNTFSVQLRSTPTSICNALLSEYTSSKSALSATFGGNLSASAPTKSLDIAATSGSTQWTLENVADLCNNAATQHLALTFQ